MRAHRRDLPAPSRRRPSHVLAALAALICLGALPAAAQPTFAKVFVPETIGVGTVSTLTFTIDNPGGTAAENLAFTDVLPAGLVLADPANPRITCEGEVSAPDGGTTISLTGGRLGAGGTCTLSVEVTSSMAGTHMNVSGDLTSSQGNSGTATDDLTVDANRVRFSKAFDPTVVLAGDTTTLTFQLENPSAANVFNINFNDFLPAGLSLANPTNLVNDCVGSVSVAPGGTNILFFGGFLAANGSAGDSCSFSVDVATSAGGTSFNLSAPVGASNGGSGAAADRLDVVVESFSKQFVPNPVAPGMAATLRFTILNLSRTEAQTDITFTDDLDATLSGLVATGLPLNDVCGAGSQISGSSLITLTGGSLPPEGTCTFDVPVAVPAAAMPGTYPNTTSPLEFDLGGTPSVGNAAVRDLVVSPFPLLEKGFTNDVVTTGSQAILEFTLTNSSSTDPATGISFTDDLTAFLGLSSPAQVLAVPAAGFCNGTGTATVISVDFLRVLFNNMTLAAGASCSFTVTVDIPADQPTGVFTNDSGPVTATVDGEATVGPGGTADLTVVGAPELSKSFTDDPVAPGATVTLEFTLSYPPDAPAGATALTFTDDLDDALSGLTALGLPAADVCGAGSQISGTDLLTLTGASLDPGESCTFPVTLAVPADALPGVYDNVTSDVSGTTTAAGAVPDTVTGTGTSDQLVVTGLTLTKSFAFDPVVAGSTVTLQFTIDNDASLPATGLTFQDDLGPVLAGLTSTDLPKDDVCGAGSQLAQVGNTLILAGGSLAANASCTFTTVLQVPTDTPAGEYPNLTTGLSGTVDGNPVTVPGAADTLLVIEPLSIAKVFTDDPVAPGGTVTLEFTISNSSPTDAASAITFTDDLGAALSGLTAVGLPASDVCGVGSTLSGTSLLTLLGGNLPANGSCTFPVTLQVPAGVPFGTVATNTTSPVTGSVGGVSTSGRPATDDLAIEFIVFAKAFAGPVGPDRTTTLTFTLENRDGTNPISGLAFTDDLGAVLPGLVAEGLPASNVCGTGSSLAGTSVITLSGASLAPGGSCSIPVTVRVPAGAAPGSYPNTTSDVLISGLPVASPATANLEVVPPPAFAKSFSPTAILEDGVSTLTFVIDNTASSIAATALDFVDNLPAGMVVATPANAATGCGGTLTATAGSGTVSLAGGTVGAGAGCTVQVNVTATPPDTYDNVSGDLTSSTGNSGSASATLGVGSRPPVFSQVFVPDRILRTGVSTLIFTIDNTLSATAATALDFTNVLPADLVVAPVPDATTTCSGGTLTANPGAGTVTYTGGSVPATGLCTVRVRVTGPTPGTYLNTSGDLTSSAGSSGPSSAELIIDPAPLEIPVNAPWALLLLAGLLALLGIGWLRSVGS